MNVLRDHYIAKLGGKCTRCGTTKNLQFDHINKSTKLYRISNIWRRRVTVIEAEIAKCQLLCIVCHAKKSAEERGRSVGGEHGLSGYTMGCRCDICTSTKRDYMRLYMQKRRLLMK